MSINRFAVRHWLACLLVALHTMLVGTFAWIELDHAWNDMNPTMLVMLAIYVVDYPIHLVLGLLIDNVKHTGTYLAATLVLGGVFWFVVGTLISYACRGVRQLFIGGQPATNGTQTVN